MVIFGSPMPHPECFYRAVLRGRVISIQPAWILCIDVCYMFLYTRQSLAMFTRSDIAHIRAWVFTHLHTYTGIQYMYMLCTYIHIYVYMYIYIYMYTYMHIHMQILNIIAKE